MQLHNLPGKYNIIGTNQDQKEATYKGTLELSLDDNNRVLAKWLINNNQKQFGKGFFHDNILVINFNYKGESNEVLKGVVVYKCITKDILDGFWSEKHGDPLYLGKERCFRIDSQINNLN